MGTNPFLFFIHLDIWFITFADVVFVGTMYASFRISDGTQKSEVHELWQLVGAIYLTLFVYVGFALAVYAHQHGGMFGMENEFTNSYMKWLLWVTMDCHSIALLLSVREKMIGPWRNGKPDFKLHPDLCSHCGFLAFEMDLMPKSTSNSFFTIKGSTIPTDSF